MQAETTRERNQAEAKRVLRRSFRDFRGCAICGVELDAILQAAHLDNNPANNSPDNLAWLCPTHHWMTDHGLYPVPAVKMLRDHWQHTRGIPDHSAVMKDAGQKALAKRRLTNAQTRRGEPRGFELFIPRDDC